MVTAQGGGRHPHPVPPGRSPLQPLFSPVGWAASCARYEGAAEGTSGGFFMRDGDTLQVSFIDDGFEVLGPRSGDGGLAATVDGSAPSNWPATGAAAVHVGAVQAVGRKAG